jgi:4-amino-4-deoxy-L-arabinose transferase-like glycosyltransferase
MSTNENDRDESTREAEAVLNEASEERVTATSGDTKGEAADAPDADIRTRPTEPLAQEPPPAEPTDPVEARRKRLKWWDHLVGLAIGSVYVGILIRTARNLGYARDEGFYFDAGRAYARWFELLFRDPHAALQRQAIDAAWTVNHEHPALMKSLFGLSWLYLHEKHKIFVEAGTAFRFPAMVMAGLALWLVYVMGTRAYSRRAGLMAAGVLALMPRVFYHAHLDCFDVPVMFWWTLVIYCYWRSVEGGIGWAIVSGIALGFALNVKFNCFMIPALVLVHWLVVRGREVGESSKTGGVPIPIAFLSMIFLGFATFVFLWPWMWSDTFVGEGGRPGRLPEYLGFHWNHPYYNMEFNGYNYFRPPFPRSYAYVMILYTVPLISLVLFAAGIIARFRYILRDASPLAWLIPPVGRAKAWNEFHRARPGDDRAGTEVLFIGAGYAILALWWKANTPIFGGTKHWFTAYPFLALFAGAGFDSVSRQLEKVLDKRVRIAWLPAVTLGIVCLLAPLALTAHSHPFGLSNYTPIAGGAPGAADKGMNRQFWGFTTGSLVEFFNREVPPNGSIYIHDTAWPSWEMMQSDGRIRRDIRVSWDIGGADFAIVHHELHMNEVDYQIWQLFQSPATFHVLTFDGVPIVSVYRRHRGR